MADSFTPMFDARVKAVLGPTNTGKTHLAITRLLAHASGVIGFPLRLLARENYDRMVAQKGEKHVALITGEEKIVPPEAKWFACTVEAMPLDRRTEFVAVDEIQLCADPDRGHIFTDRLLNARGMVETMFLGAETIRPLLQRLVPRAEVETRPRLSQLTHAGVQKLTRLPPRSAVVAFSAAEVYAIAEAIRRRRGGCAVVMGRLSPRTRNAQVALYQNREVDFLVATDAIGMGLNMDVDHVAFASLQKFDGHALRGLTAQEAAQIAGRAGRGMRDGSFGVTADSPPLPEEMVGKIENHQFEALQAIAWRNSDLDFTSIDALLDSLAAPAPQPGLSKGHDAVDHITLSHLAREAEIRALASSRARVGLLWEACQVPDFRKLADDSHTRLCARIFTHLVQDGALPADWIGGQIAQCGSTEGDLDTLMARLASIRVWAYVAARADWVRDAARFQGEARAAEDAVSDALHERLMARFVDRRAAHLIRRLDDTEETLLSAVTRKGEVVVEGHPVGHIEGFQFHPDPSTEGEEERKLVLRAARRALREEMPRRVAALETAKDEVFALTADHRIAWTHPGGEPATVARLRPGPEAGKPLIEVISSEFLDGAQRERIRARLAKFIESVLTRELGAIAAVEAKAEADNTLRGPAFLLRESLGLAPGGTEETITPEVRQKLKLIGIRAGRFALFIPEALKPRAMALRAQIWAMSRNIPTPALPPPGLVSLAVRLPEPARPARPTPPAEAAQETATPAMEAAPPAELPGVAPMAPIAEPPPAADADTGMAAPVAGDTVADAAAAPAEATAPPRRPGRAPLVSAAGATAADAPPAGWPSGFAQAMGWLPAGPALIRLDVAERIAGELAYLTRRAPAPPPSDLASRLGVKADSLAPVLSALGFRLLEPPPLGEDAYGPPTPVRVAQIRARQAPDRRGGGNWRDREGGPRQPRRAPQGDHKGEGQRHGGPRQGQADGQGRDRRYQGGEGSAEPAREGQTQQNRRDQQRGPGPAGGQGHGGPRQDRPPRQWPDRRAQDGAPRQDGPPRRDQGGAPPRPAPKEKGPNPDSPFAILAQLKLR
jgi:ATP-dependent RNA helicase SUPV3L1/SUV3